AGIPGLALPPEEKDVRSSWHLFPIRVHDAKRTRREVYDGLRSDGILAQVHYIPIHLHPYYHDHFGFRRGRFPAAEAFYEDELSLPLHATMDGADALRVSDSLRRLLD